MKITIVAGARPNFMKIAPIIRAINKHNRENSQIAFRLVHTGQHYDDRLSKVFFNELELPEPDVNLGAGSGTQAEQTARIMIEFEKDLVTNPTDMVLVVGDVTSTMACTIVAKKLNTRVAHVEGGIRSFDMSMPEEINRIVTDSLADYFFTTSEVANNNLLRSGASENQIFFVGNTMIDSLQFSLPKLMRPVIWEEQRLVERAYIILTLHRPSNVDELDILRNVLTKITTCTAGVPIIFPIHPRTRKNFEKIKEHFSSIIPIDPLSYFEFIYMIKHAKAVVTDSGGVQEETTVLGIPCVTLRKNTERPETVTIGTNELVGDNLGKLAECLHQIQTGIWKRGSIPPMWDGRAAERIVSIMTKLL